MTVLKLVTTCGLATVLLFKVALHSQRMSYFYSVSYEPMDGSYMAHVQNHLIIQHCITEASYHLLIIFLWKYD